MLVNGHCPNGPNPPTGYSDYDAITETFYKFENLSMKTFPDAKADCESEGATLFMGKTKLEWDFVLQRNHGTMKYYSGKKRILFFPRFQWLASSTWGCSHQAM